MLMTHSPINSGSLASSAQHANLILLPPFLIGPFRLLLASAAGVVTPGASFGGRRGSCAMAANEPSVADSDRTRTSSTSSYMAKRSSSSHSGCCPPLFTLLALTVRGEAGRWATYRFIGFVLCLCSFMASVQNGFCFPKRDLLGRLRCTVSQAALTGD
jgi:hypothetical protein